MIERKPTVRITVAGVGEYTRTGEKCEAHGERGRAHPVSMVFKKFKKTVCVDDEAALRELNRKRIVDGWGEE